MINMSGLRKLLVKRDIIEKRVKLLQNHSMEMARKETSWAERLEFHPTLNNTSAFFP
jgi:hypothetical protein